MTVLNDPADDWRVRMGFDLQKPMLPQVATTALVLGLFFGGLGLGLVGLAYFPPLWLGATIYEVCAATFVACIALAFAVVPRRVFPAGIPLKGRVLARVGWALSATFFLLGLFMVVNGYGTPASSRTVDCVGKRMSRERNPDHRQYSLELRAWPGQASVAEVDVTRRIYEAVNVRTVDVDTPQATLDALPTQMRVRLKVGIGRLGVEWLENVGFEPSLTERRRHDTARALRLRPEG
jgi:hypothetical protein